jgi:DNA-binding winged helix-turn-helix (wHTH) protein/predicted ATPase
MFYVFGDCSLDTQLRELRRAGAPVKLTPKEYQTLVYLVQHSDHVVTKAELLEHVWPDVYVDDNAVARCITAVRHAVGDHRHSQRIIRTLHVQGYRFIAPLAVHAQTPQTQSPASVTETPPPLAPSQAEAVPSAPAAPPAPRLLSAERKLVTVLCGALSPSPSQVLALDLDTQRTLSKTMAALVRDAAQQYEGTVQYLANDGFALVFGAPRAQEDHARRATLTALMLQRQWMAALAAITPPPQVSLALRCGLHSGPAAVEEEDNHPFGIPLIVGDAPVFAAQLARHPVSDTVLCSAATYQLIRGYFDCRRLDTQTLPGFAAPFRVYAIVRESGVQSRFDAAIRSGLTPFVGRDEELELLLQRWERARNGEGQVVLLSGEPGIGKSRLTRELKVRAAHDGAVWIEFRCSPYHQHSAFSPILEHLQRLLQFQPDDTPDEKLDKLRSTLTRYRFPQPETFPLLAALLSLPHPPDTPPLALSPQKQRQIIQETLAAWLFEEAEQYAVCNVWEDLQWADPSTLEVLTLHLAQIPTARLLTVLTFRPEFMPPWGARSYFHTLTLTRLAPQHAEEMTRQVLGEQVLTPELFQQIVAKTDGVPLFIEELTKAVLESVAAHGSVPLPSPIIPATLEDSLMARLDRLGAAKEIAQLGAILGREFSYELFRVMTPLDEELLQRRFKQLIDAELLYQRGVPPHAQYTFKHALVQQATYQSLLESERRRLHQQAAHALEQNFATTVETQPELVAHHYTEAGLASLAIPYWQRAGQRAVRRSANLEAICHLTTGLELLQRLPDTPDRDRRELQLQATLGAALIAAKGYVAVEVEHTYERARTLCQRLDESAQLFPVLLGLLGMALVRAEHHKGRALGEQLLALTQTADDPVRLQEAHYALGHTLFLLGELVRSQEHLQQAVALHDLTQHLLPAAGTAQGVQAASHVSIQNDSESFSWIRGVQDPGAISFAYAAWNLWFLGYPDQALRRSQEALALARSRSHPFSVAKVTAYAAALHQYRQETSTVKNLAEATVAVGAEHGFPTWLGMGAFFHHWTLAQQEEHQASIEQIRQGIATWQATGAALFRPYHLALLAEACGKAGQTEEGLEALAQALATVQQTGERYYEAELYRLKGELTLAQSRVQGLESSVKTGLGSSVQSLESEAEGYFLKAIEVARKQQAKSLELRATTSLARLWQQQGKQHEARNTLSEIYGWFTEGFDTKDLQEAKALLNTLA